jgi:hypothetical protein|tara:strand:- start:353 stop:598 length:246 start_codon:yes stop_codon:yes gene_type:complete
MPEVILVLDLKKSGYKESTMSESFGKWLTRLFISQPKEDLTKMSKTQLEAKGREVGIELDRRYTKERLVKKLEKHLADHYG